MDDIHMPTLVVDEDKCRRNIRHMKEKADKDGTVLRPHFKTHQSAAIGEWYRDAGVSSITVSSFSMAQYFARFGWKDIMVAFPFNPLEIETLNQLAPDTHLSILIADHEVIPALLQGIRHHVDFYIKLEVGSFRAGFRVEDKPLIDKVLEQTASNQLLTFKGFVAHAGHTYQTTSLNEVHKIYREGSQHLTDMKNDYLEEYPDIIASWGDTPTCSMINEFEGIDEIRPGNFIFYDLMQYHLASCDWDQISLVVAAPVVARYKYRNEVLLYAGAVHLSKDFIHAGDRSQVYGELVKFTDKGWERYPEPLFISRLSQEHGIFKCPDDLWENFKPGTLVGIVPVHSCLTVNLMKNFYELNSGSYLIDDQRQ